MENTQYKGFAYTKGNNKPTVLFGETRDDILKKLNVYNAARTQEYKFSTCSIGSLDAGTDKYTDYHKYEVATGKELPKIYLEIPPLKKEEFQKVTADLKAAGASFDPNKKQWYYTSDQAGTTADFRKFYDICNQFSEQKTIDPQSIYDTEKDQEETAAGKWDFQIEGVEVQYAVKLGNKTVIIPESEINMWDVKGSKDEFLNRLNDRAVERTMLQPQPQITDEQIPEDPEQLVRESEYTISASRDAHDNRCTIWYNDGREPIELRGDAYGLSFPGMSSEEVADFVSGYLKYMEQPERIRTEYAEGDEIDCYVPLRLNVDPNQPVYVENVSHVVGHIRDVKTLFNTDAKIYEILQEGNVRTIRSDEIYAPDQARVLLRAAADELTGVQFDLLADRNLSAAQMEEIRFGFKDGLTAEQVALYANPEMTPAEMDMCRIGLTNGLGYAEISRLLKETKELSWTDSRNRLNEAVKDHREIEPEPEAPEQISAESTMHDEGSIRVENYAVTVPVENGRRVIDQEAVGELVSCVTEHGIDTGSLSFDLKNCIFRGVTFQDSPAHADLFKNTDFSGSEFHQCRIRADMRGSSFQDTIFTDTSFKAGLSQCDFSRSQITNCRFQDSTMLEVNFSEAAMKETGFYACEMENNDFYKTKMDAVKISESCGVIDSKHFDTISAENMTERTLWQLSGVSKVTYEHKEELQKFFRQEQEDNLDPENEDWRLELSRDERELVDKWEKQQYGDKAHGGKQPEVSYERELCKEITKHGYKPTGKLISNFRKLDMWTGHAITMIQICCAYKNGCAGMDPEQKDAIEQIVQECKQQELARMAAVPEV